MFLYILVACRSSRILLPGSSEHASCAVPPSTAAPSPIIGHLLAETPALRKARGAFYTPPELSRFIVEWAIRTPHDQVLEPSCGDAEFLLAAADRLKALGVREQSLGGHLQGVEVHPQAAVAATERLRTAGAPTEIEVADFFDFSTPALFDAVVGNPPYVRYQQFAGRARKKGLEAALAQGVRLTGLSSSWAPFVVHASRFLKPNGRLGLVLPAELLTVNYAASIRDFLLRRFATIRLVAFEERVFPGVSEEVVLLLAEGTGGADDFELTHVRGLSGLLSLSAAKSWTPSTSAGKWTAALLPSGTAEAYKRLAETESFTPLASWGDVYLGGVTGNNDFFALSAASASKWEIPEHERLRISPPGSKHLRRTTFTHADWQACLDAGQRGYLFFPDPAAPSGASERYIEAGAAKGVQDAYKCRVRKPWWRVPIVPAPDLFLTYMNHRYPRLVTNEAGVHHLNSVHGVRLHGQMTELGRELLPLATLNTLSLLGAEMVGRAYGGGVLKLEPREAAHWMVPAPEAVSARHMQLVALRDQVLAEPEMPAERVIERVDRVILRDLAGLSEAELRQLRHAREALVARRSTRGGRSRGAH